MNTEVTLTPDDRPGQPPRLVIIESDPTRWTGVRNAFGRVIWLSAFRSRRVTSDAILSSVGGWLAFHGDTEGSRFQCSRCC